MVANSSQTSSFGVDGQLTDRALRALLKHHEATSSSGEKEQLLGDDLDVQVQFSLVRIPGNASPKPIRIEIPNPLVKVAASMDDDDNDNLQDVEACLIVKEESKPWVQEMVARFPSQLGCIKRYWDCNPSASSTRASRNGANCSIGSMYSLQTIGYCPC